VSAAVWKFPIPINDEFTLRMPRDAELLFVASQNEQGCLWARVITDYWVGVVDRRFLLRGTGHEVDRDCKYVGSFMLRGGALVFHLFEAAT
jgi:hypothetical protein